MSVLTITARMESCGSHLYFSLFDSSHSNDSCDHKRHSSGADGGKAERNRLQRCYECPFEYSRGEARAQFEDMGADFG